MREPIFNPDKVWQIIHWLVFMAGMVAFHKVFQWFIVDILGWFPR